MKESMNDENKKIDPEITAEGPEELKFEPEIADSDEYPHQHKDVIADLRKKLKKAVDEKQEYLLGWQKAKADFINSRKQDEEDMRSAVKYAEAALLTELIPVLDSFDMAFANESEIEKLPEQWRKGVTQIRNQLKSILIAHGLEVIDPIGRPFDPREAEAVGMVAVEDEKDDHQIMSVFQKGYKLHGRVLRPAKVRVGQYQ